MYWIFSVKFIDLGDSCKVGGTLLWISLSHGSQSLTRLSSSSSTKLIVNAFWNDRNHCRTMLEYTIQQCNFVSRKGGGLHTSISLRVTALPISLSALRMHTSPDYWHGVLTSLLQLPTLTSIQGNPIQEFVITAPSILTDRSVSLIRHAAALYPSSLLISPNILISFSVKPSVARP